MLRKKWNLSDIDTLINMKKGRYSIKDIANILNVTPNAVSKALQRYSDEYSDPYCRNIKIIPAPKLYVDEVVQWMKSIGYKIIYTYKDQLQFYIHPSKSPMEYYDFMIFVNTIRKRRGYTCFTVLSL